MPLCKPAFFVNIYLAYFDSALIFTGKLIEKGADHLTWPAPGGPKIN
jgi:hypothetical protein